MTAVLTNTAIASLLPGEEIKCERVPGLTVRCHRSGRSFMLYYRTRSGVKRRPRIGDADTLKISEARDIAKAMLVKVAAGGDPSAEQADARGEPTMDNLWARVEREHYNKGKAWDAEAKRLYERNASPKIGKVRLRALGYDDVARMHAGMKDTPSEANLTLAVVSKMLSLAEVYGPPNNKWRDLHSNPCAHVARYPVRKRKRYAKPAEISAIGPLLDRYAQDPRHVSGVAFLYILMFSGARPSEIENGTPKQLERVERDGKVYGVLRLDGKTGARDVFLPPQAMAVIDKLPAGRSRLANRRTMPRALWETVRKEAGCTDLWARDWRRTFATTGMSDGVSMGTIGELLGHASVQTTKIYAKLMEDPAHAAAAGIADKLESLLKATPSGPGPAGQARS